MASRLQYSYRFEDLLVSTVPVASLGKRDGVSVNGMKSMIRIARVIHHTDFWRRRCTEEKLRLAQWCVSEIAYFVPEGRAD